MSEGTGPGRVAVHAAASLPDVPIPGGLLPAAPPPATGQRPFAVVLGADSLRFRRSGVGRVTLEVARALGQEPSVAALRLWMDGRWHEAGSFPDLAGTVEPPVPARPDTRLRLVARGGRRLVGGMPGVRQGRRAMLERKLVVAARQLRAEHGGLVYHEPNMVPFPFDGVTVVQVNDLSWLHHPDMHPIERIQWMERNRVRMLDQPRRFVAISEWTAAGLVAELGIARHRIDVVPCAPSAAFAPVDDPARIARVLGARALVDRGYVLSVSTIEPRKNFDRLARAHAALAPALRRRFPLVIAGGDGWGRVLDDPAVTRAKADGTLRLLGHVPDDDLACLTARCACFAYVSLYEGFGLPVVEAMAAGAPVVASSTTATGETAGNAALLVDPTDVDAIAAGIRRVLEDKVLAHDLCARGFDRASGFTWRRSAGALVESWRRAMK